MGFGMNKTCLVIGNGPSLAEIPNEFLSQYPTFGSNRIYLRFTPDYYAWIDPRNLKQSSDQINKMKCKKFIVNHQSHLIEDAVPLYDRPNKKFSYNPLEWVWGGHSVTFVLLQLAYYYGFERVGLIGIDHRYLEPKNGQDQNHFTKSYYDADDKWWLPDLSKVEMSYSIAKQAFENNYREIINITPNSALEIFPKENWEDWRI